MLFIGMEIVFAKCALMAVVKLWEEVVIFVMFMVFNMGYRQMMIVCDMVCQKHLHHR